MRWETVTVAATLLLLRDGAMARHPEDKWDDRIDPACCPYPEHDPRDYNWPYSHFQYSEIIPDVVGSFVAMTDLNLTYDGGNVVEYGKPVSPAAVSRSPKVSFALGPDRNEDTLHTLIMVDPDVPFRDSPNDGEWLHWLLYDIRGNDTSTANTLVEYAPPTPQQCPAHDKLCLKEHRITFILWEQPHGPLKLHEEDLHIKAAVAAGRARYKARDFAARHRLGLQIALNFFETYFDPGDGTFDAQPWYHVRDDASLAQRKSQIAHVERDGVQATRGVGKEEL